MNNFLIFSSDMNFHSCMQDKNFDFKYISNPSEITTCITSGVFSALIVDCLDADSRLLADINDLCDIFPLKCAVFLRRGCLADVFMKEGIHYFISKDNIDAALADLSVSGKNSRTGILSRALNRLKIMTNSLSQGVVIFNNKMFAIYANKAAQDILEMDSSLIMKRTPDDIFTLQPYSDQNQDEVHYDQMRHVTKDGRELVLDTIFSRVSENGETTGYILLMNRVSAVAMDRRQELELLQFQQRYHSTQQYAAFKKQMLVIKDETSGICNGKYSFETYFKPLDIMSGDIYGSIDIKDGRYFFYIIDAMGKGLSASVTAVQSSSFINHALELAIIKNDFDMSKVLQSFTHYIRDRLMEEEALCAQFALVDTNTDTMSVCGFGMPPVLLCMEDGTVTRVPSQNMPIMRFLTTRKTLEISLKGVCKLLLYSDGLSEAETTDGGLYFEHMSEHFKKAVSKKHLLSMVNNCSKAHEDDVTFFMIFATEPEEISMDSFQVNSSLTEIGKASDFIRDSMDRHSVSEDDRLTIEFAIGEMLMNALEHGSLDISFAGKNRMISNGTFDTYLSEEAKEGSDFYDKKISIKCGTVKRRETDDIIFVVVVEDEGKGFIVPDIFKYQSFDGNLNNLVSDSYNGRGIFITDNLVDALFYNTRGNRVYIIKILERAHT